MHRSGTSVIAAVVSTALGKASFAKGGANGAGEASFEKFQRFNQRALSSSCVEGEAGYPNWGWTESEQLDTSHVGQSREQAERLVAAHSSSANWWGCEDPSALPLLDYWNEWVDEPRYILVYRYPWDVADSMQRLGEEVFLRNPEYAYRIWEFYNRRLRDFYIANSDRCVLVSINALAANLDKFVMLLVDKLGLKVKETELEQVLAEHVINTIGGEDPLIDLVGAVWPRCTDLLTELDGLADISGDGLWNLRPHKTRLSRPDANDGKQIDLSVITPCYQQGIFLIEAVASVERHAPDNTEFIIVNDGSTDPRTLEILEMLRGYGYFVLDQENAGLSESRNRGIAMSHGRYILPLDDDNRIRDFLSEAVDVLDSMPDVGVVYGDRNDFGLKNRVMSLPDFDLNELLKANYIDACAVFRKQLWIECGGYDPNLSPLEDWGLWIQAAELGWKFHHIPRVTLDYRTRPSSLIYQLHSIELWEEFWRRIRVKHSELYWAMVKGELDEAEKQLELLSAKVAWADKERARLISELDLGEGERQRLMAEANVREAERYRHITELEAGEAERQRLLSLIGNDSEERQLTADELHNLTTRLAQQDEQLKKIKSSMGWRVLSSYGRVKYRYLLPIYRLFGQAPSKQIQAKPDA